MRMETNTGKHRVIQNFTGTQLHAKGWIQEAALRMLMNNLNPEVAERPLDLVVYGGRQGGTKLEIL